MYKRIAIVAALVGAMVPAALGQMNSTDKTFAEHLAKSNNYEIKAAELAQTMSKNSAYKPYAQMIINDHTKAGEQLTHVVAGVDSSMQLPTGVSANGQQHLDALKNAGDNFDTTYRDQMISTHVAAIKLVQNYVSQPNDNAKLKHFAENLLPVLRKHLRRAKKLPKQ